VGSLGEKRGAAEIRDKLIQRLRKARGTEIVAVPDEADAVITGTGEIWLKGYVSASPKASAINRQAVYDGYLSIQLRGKDNATLWSCVVAPGNFAWNGATQDLDNRLVKKLLAALHPDNTSKP
jgi:hypothetical protein